jgi:tripartite ATP-independent transporter DctP family solute receptor
MGAAWVRATGMAATLLLGTWAVSPAAWSAPAAEPQTLQLGIGLPADSVQGRAVQDFAERVARYTDGKLRVELHAGGSLGNDLTMLKALRENRLAMTAPDSSTLAPLEKAFSAINYPFTFFNEAEADAVLDGPWGQRLLDRLPQHGLVGLAYWENGFRHLTNQRRAIHSVADFAGLKMRTMQNPMLVDSFARLGFEPVPMPFPQVYEALRSQAVDGQENPLPTILSSRFYEVQKHLTLSRHIYSVHVLLIAKTLWDGFDAPTQTALKKAALESRDVERRLSRAAAEKALAELQAKGMQVTSIPRADAERIRNRLREVFNKHNQDIGSTTVIDLYLELGRLRTAAPR